MKSIIKLTGKCRDVKIGVMFPLLVLVRNSNLRMVSGRTGLQKYK